MDDKNIDYSKKSDKQNIIQETKSQLLPRSYSSQNVNISQSKFTQNNLGKRNTLLPQNEQNTFEKQGQKSQLNKQFDKSIMNLDLPGCKMKQQTDWVYDTKCSICLQQYNKMKLLTEHHCRYCANSVCGECSKRTINQQRVCDFCFLKKQLRNSEKRRKEFLISKDEGILQMKESILNLDEQSKLLEKQIADQEINFKIEQNKMLSKLSQIQEEVRQSEETLRKRRENNARLKQAVENDASILKEKELENNQLKDKIQALQIEINFKKNKIQMKQGDYLRLIEQNEKQKQAQSFVDLEQSQLHNLEGERMQYEIDKQKALNTNSSVKKQMESNLESIREEPQIEQGDENGDSQQLEKVKQNLSKQKEKQKKLQENQNKQQFQEEDEEDEEEFEVYQNEYQEDNANENENQIEDFNEKKKKKKGKKDGCIIF